MTFCEEYNSTISYEFCARRYQKATENPNDASLMTCRECEHGKLIYSEEPPEPVQHKHKKYVQKNIHPCPACGMETRGKLCVICNTTKGEEKMTRKSLTKTKICQSCSNKYQPTSNVQKRCPECAAIKFAEKQKLRVSKAPAGHIAEHRHNKGKDAEPGTIPATTSKSSSGKLILGQMLYTSDLLDRQISEAIETGMVDTKVILDIRFRLGEVLRTGGGLEA